MSKQPKTMRGAGARLFLAAALTFLLAGCELIKPLMEETTEMNPCDPVANLYEGGHHYIERDYVKEDGTLDFNRWFKSRKVESSPCDPLKNRKGPEINGDLPSEPKKF